MSEPRLPWKRPFDSLRSLRALDSAVVWRDPRMAAGHERGRRFGGRVEWVVHPSSAVILQAVSMPTARTRCARGTREH